MTKTELLTKLNYILQAPSTTPVRTYDTVIKEAINHIEDEPEWIPVDERLPEQHDSPFVGKKGIPWYEYKWKKESDYVLVTVDIKGKKEVSTANTHDGKWFGFYDIYPEAKVTAWMPLPLPKPYKGE